MAVLCIDRELILTLFHFHSHICNVKITLKAGCSVEAMVADGGWILRSFQAHYLITSSEK